MSGRAYLLVVIVCAAWLGARAATQPAGFDFDERAHLGTIAEMREFSGLAPAHLFPEIIVNPRTVEPRFHMFPPLPYLVVAGATAAAQTDPTSAGVLGVARALSALMALLAVVSVGLAVRNLQQPGSTWSVPALVTVGLALTPGLHSMGASVTVSTWALAAVGMTCAATAWAVRRDWSLGATAAVAGAAAFTVAARASAYPVLLLIPLAILASRVTLGAAVLGCHRGCCGCDSGQRLVDGAECLGHRRPTRCERVPEHGCRCGCLRHCARKPGVVPCGYGSLACVDPADLDRRVLGIPLADAGSQNLDRRTHHRALDRNGRAPCCLCRHLPGPP